MMLTQKSESSKKHIRLYICMLFRERRKRKMEGAGEENEQQETRKTVESFLQKQQDIHYEQKATRRQPDNMDNYLI